MDSQQADGQEVGSASTGRDETPNEQQDRNWDDVLQELRVMQTGVQIIAGFLLTLPFQSRFADLDSTALTIYLLLVVIAAGTTCLMLLPVSLHRQLFRLRQKDKVVGAGHRIIKVVLMLVGLLITGTTTLIFYVVVGSFSAAVVALTFAVGLICGLYLYPRIARRDHG